MASAQQLFRKIIRLSDFDDSSLDEQVFSHNNEEEKCHRSYLRMIGGIIMVVGLFLTLFQSTIPVATHSLVFYFTVSSFLLLAVHYRFMKTSYLLFLLFVIHELPSLMSSSSHDIVVIPAMFVILLFLTFISQSLAHYIIGILFTLAVMGARVVHFVRSDSLVDHRGDVVLVYITLFIIIFCLMLVSRNVRKNSRSQKILLAENRERLHRIQQLAGGIAHDFNNQLSTVLGNAELLDKALKESSLELDGYTAEIIESSTNAAALTAQLLAFSQKGKYQSVAVDMHLLIDNVLDQFSRDLPLGITIERDFSSEYVGTIGDPNQLYEVVRHIGINALEAIEGEGTITFSTSLLTLKESKNADLPSGKYLQISINDTGVGMSRETCEQIFDPFFTTKEDGKTVGMGLAAVQGTVIHHNGQVTVESSPQTGTTISLILPFHEPNNTLNHISQHNIIDTEKELVITVDDDPGVLKVTSKILDKLGYSVLSFSNGMDALEYFEENHLAVKLVLLDLRMPIISGADTFRELMKIDPNSKVLLASGYSVEEEAQLLLNEGALGFMQKPFKIDLLQKKIEDILGL